MDQSTEILFTRQIYINLFTAVIPVMLIVQVLHRKHRTPEINIFLRMCILNLLQCFVYITACFLVLKHNDYNEDLVYIIALICNALMGIIPLVLAVHWLLFVEYTLHQSLDILRRRYPVLMIPFYIGVVIAILGIIVPIPESVPESVLNFIGVLNKLGLLIWCFYVLGSYVVLYNEKKRKLIPQYIKLTPTVLSIMVGLIVAGLSYYLLDALGYAVGLMFADYYMFRRLSYIDPKTGFFNEKYISVLEREAKKKNIHYAMVIKFKTTGAQEKLVGILRNWEPEHCKVVSRDDGEYLVISDIQKRYIAERFIYLVKENCQAEGIDLESSYETIRR